MTWGLSGLHRQRVKARLINFPATTLDAAEALGVDVDRFCIESLRRLVESMEANVKAVPKQLNAKPAAMPASKPGRGRPPKEAGRVPVTRALHFWASGKPMMPTNEEHLQRLLSVLRKIDRGSASANRRELLAAREDSAIALDLLQERQYDAVVSLISTTTAVTRISTPKLAPQALALRTPPPPEKLIDALQDRIHQDLSTVRIAKSVRVKRDG